MSTPINPGQNATLGFSIKEDHAQTLQTAIIDSAPAGIIAVNPDGRIVFVNRELQTLLGYARDELLGKSIQMLVPEPSRSAHIGYMRSFNAAPHARAMGSGRDLHALRKDGTEIPVEIALKPLDTVEGKFILAILIDITERKQLEAQIQRASAQLEQRVTERTAELERANRKNQALLADLKTQGLELERLSREDPLTQLANRRDFDKRLREEIQRAKRFGTPLAVAMIDLDHFKKVNDQFGHPLGDTVLREAAHLMRHECRAIDIIARYGGEEFALALPNSDLAKAFNVCERIRHAFEHFDWNHFAPGLHVTISAGISNWATGINANELLAQADANLYEAKHNGRNRVIAVINDSA